MGRLLGCDYTGSVAADGMSQTGTVTLTRFTTNYCTFAASRVQLLRRKRVLFLKSTEHFSKRKICSGLDMQRRIGLLQAEQARCVNDERGRRLGLETGMTPCATGQAGARPVSRLSALGAMPLPMMEELYQQQRPVRRLRLSVFVLAAWPR